jgi:hypothetical protein
VLIILGLRTNDKRDGTAADPPFYTAHIQSLVSVHDQHAMRIVPYNYS